MSIQRKPKPPTTVEEFVAGAPDAQTSAASPGTYEKGIKKGNKRQISLTIAPDLLRRVDEVAKRTGQGPRQHHQHGDIPRPGRRYLQELIDIPRILKDYS